ncbi:MAG: arsenite methyltransferase [Pyrinomonadaceae bacterium]|nr:arsenite methyltransferase [Pyrinomonadaceae bacterium]
MSQEIFDAVRANYGAVAQSGLSSEHSGVRAVAEAFGYTAEELTSIPAEANMGLSCGNPTAIANLREGETVVDLGSGGGLDVFLASAKVGPEGRAIGIDMTKEMIELARRNAEKQLEAGAINNVEFHLATIDKLPLEDSTVDCVISNCVINLAPDKKAVFCEIARVLKPGGRVAVSDIALKQPLPAEVSSDISAYVGCIAGAVTIDDYRQGLIEAGFTEVLIVDSRADLNAYAQIEGQSACCSPAMEETENDSAKNNPTASACCAPASSQSVPQVSSCCAPVEAVEPADGSFHNSLSDLMARYNVNDYAASVKVFAVKPS